MKWGMLIRSLKIIICAIIVVCGWIVMLGGPPWLGAVMASAAGILVLFPGVADKECVGTQVDEMDETLKKIITEAAEEVRSWPSWMRRPESRRSVAPDHLGGEDEHSAAHEEDRARTS